MRFQQCDFFRNNYVFEVEGEPTLEEIKATIVELTDMFGTPHEYLVEPWSYDVTQTGEQLEKGLFLDSDGTWRTVATLQRKPTASILVLLSDEAMASRFKLAYC